MRDIYAPKKTKKNNQFPLANLIKYLIVVLAAIVIIYFGLKIVNAQIDKWLDSVDKLKKDVDELGDDAAPEEDDEDMPRFIPRDADEIEDLEDEIGGLEDDVEDLEDDIEDQQDDAEDAMDSQEAPKSFQSWIKNKDKTHPIDA